MTDKSRDRDPAVPDVRYQYAEQMLTALPPGLRGVVSDEHSRVSTNARLVWWIGRVSHLAKFRVLSDSLRTCSMSVGYRTAVLIAIMHREPR